MNDSSSVQEMLSTIENRFMLQKAEQTGPLSEVVLEDYSQLKDSLKQLLLSRQQGRTVMVARLLLDMTQHAASEDRILRPVFQQQLPPDGLHVYRRLQEAHVTSQRYLSQLLDKTLREEDFEPVLLQATAAFSGYTGTMQSVVLPAVEILLTTSESSFLASDYCRIRGLVPTEGAVHGDRRRNSQL